MRKEISAGGIIFHCNPQGNIRYLLIQSKTWKNWAFPKGHIEKDESEEKTALREIFEETGLSLNLLPGFLESYTYEFDFRGEHIQKKAVFFLAESTDTTIELNETEHQEYRWLLYEEAMQLITYIGDKELLSKANNFLIKK
ncbi:MAG: NUDIX domain-containing protein [Candidatus Nanoarchaeia archaeon]